MALIQCSECKQEISHKAYICPHCGFVARRSFINRVLILFFGTMFLVILDKVLDIYIAIQRHFL